MCKYYKKEQSRVEKYISDRESSGKLPSRALVSLDILNMFNEISRETLCEIIATNFPSLEGFADMLYEEDGETYVKIEDGSWAVIPVIGGAMPNLFPKRIGLAPKMGIFYSTPY